MYGWKQSWVVGCVSLLWAQIMHNINTYSYLPLTMKSSSRPLLQRMYDRNSIKSCNILPPTVCASVLPSLPFLLDFPSHWKRNVYLKSSPSWCMCEQMYFVGYITLCSMAQEWMVFYCWWQWYQQSWRADSWSGGQIFDAYGWAYFWSGRAERGQAVKQAVRQMWAALMEKREKGEICMYERMRGSLLLVLHCHYHGYYYTSNY